MVSHYTAEQPTKSHLKQRLSFINMYGYEGARLPHQQLCEDVLALHLSPA